MRLDILTEHSEEIEILWSRRRAMLVSPRETLTTLAALERRLGAHIAGLAVDREGAHDCFASGLASKDPDATFAIIATLLRIASLSSRDRALTAARAERGAGSRGVTEAFAWMPLDPALEPRLRAALRDEDGPMRAFATAVLGAHMALAPSERAAAVADADARVRMAIAQAAVANGAESAALTLLAEDELAAVRTAALGALAAAGAPDALDRIRSEHAAHRSCELLELLGRIGDDADVTGIREAAREPELAEVAIRALGALATTAAAEALLDCMQEAAIAPAAGEAFWRITGLEPAERKVAASTADDDAGFEETRPMPDFGATTAWWQKHRAKFASGERWRDGKPLEHARWLASPHAGDLLTRREELTRLRASGPGTHPKLALDAPARRQRESTEQEVH